MRRREALNLPIACSKYSNNDIMRLMVAKGARVRTVVLELACFVACGGEKSGDFRRERVLESLLPCRTTALFLGARPTVRRLSACLFTSFQLMLLFVVLG